MAKNENRNTNRVESVVRASVQRKIGGKIASKIASSAIAKSVGSALGSTLGSVVPIVGNVLGGVLGNAISGGIVVLSKNLGKALGALPFALSNLGSNVAQVVAASLAQALGTSFAFMTAAIVVLAIFASFTMFIINSGAYIVPPGVLTQIDTGGWPTINVGASCPIPNGIILTGSYGSPNGSTQHGTNEYWDSLSRQCTAWSIPYTGGCFARQFGDQCYEQYGGCDEYGLAADFIYPGIQSGGQPVYLPYIEGESVNWTVEWAAADPQGRGILSTVYNNTNYTIYVTHLQAAPIGGASGIVFGKLYANTTFTPHLHIELRIDGVFVPPDFMCS